LEINHIILLLTTAKAKIPEIRLHRIIPPCENINIKVIEGDFQVWIKNITYRIKIKTGQDNWDVPSFECL
jgi:molybdenum cofactor biosynthesis enzyme